MASSPAQSTPEAQTQAQTDQPKTYTPGGEVSKPKLLYSVDPPYTDLARKKKVKGVTVLSIVINPDGKPTDIKVVRSLADSVKPKQRAAAEELDQSALRTVEQYRFQPSMLHGQAVPVSIKIEINFQLF